MDRHDTSSLYLEALFLCKMAGIDPAEEFGAEQAIEMQNFISAYDYDREKETPAKTWWHLDLFNPAIYRALRIDPKDVGAPYAVQPFRLYHDGDRHVVLVPFPQPKILDEYDNDWLGVEHVMAWNPVDDTAYIMGDAQPQLIGNFEDDGQGTIFASPRDFLTELVRARASFFVRWCQSRKGEWAHGAREYDATPGKLAVGDVSKIRWSGLPHTLHCRGIDPQQINRAVLRQANLPRAVAQVQRIAA